MKIRWPWTKKTETQHWAAEAAARDLLVRLGRGECRAALVMHVRGGPTEQYIDVSGGLSGMDNDIVIILSDTISRFAESKGVPREVILAKMEEIAVAHDKERAARPRA